MTHRSRDTRPVYISGPMTGYPEHNIPAFEWAEKVLTSMGYKVVNPIYNLDGDHSQPWGVYMCIDFDHIKTCQGVFVLDGWDKSVGAVLEVIKAVATNRWVKHLVKLHDDAYEVRELEPHLLPDFSRPSRDRFREHGSAREVFAALSII